MKKKSSPWKIGILSFLIAFAIPAGALAENANNVTVLIDGKKLQTDTPARILNSRTVVPYNALFTALGAKISWEANTSTITAVKDDTTIVMAIGQNIAFVNNQPMKMDVAPRIINSRTMVPFSFFLGTLGYKSAWDAKTYTVKITTGTAAPPPAGTPTAPPSSSTPALPSTGMAPPKDTGTPTNEFTGCFAMQNLAGIQYVVQIRSDNTYFIRNLGTGKTGSGSYAVEASTATFTGEELQGAYTVEKISSGRTYFLMKGASEEDVFAITAIAYEDFAAQY